MHAAATALRKKPDRARKEVDDMVIRRKDVKENCWLKPSILMHHNC
jgi:hypothetical protein